MTSTRKKKKKSRINSTRARRGGGASWRFDFEAPCADRRSAWSPRSPPPPRSPPGAPEAKSYTLTVVHRREKKNKTTSDS